MKKLIPLIFVISFAMQGCYTLNYGGKKPLFLIDAPANVTVTNKSTGKQIRVQDYSAYTQSQSIGNSTIRTHYYYPGFLLKLKMRNAIQISDGKKTTVVEFKGKAAVAGLIVETIFTFGIGSIIDIATNSFRYPKARFIDVRALLNGTPPRTQKEMKRVMYTNSRKD